MDEKNPPKRGQQTAWHPLVVFTIERFAPADRKVFCEFYLNRLPQRVDIVVVEQQDVPAKPARKLRSIFDHLRKHTLIEYKGVTDDLEPSDVFILLGYACQYMTMHDLSELDEMCLMFIADRIPKPFVERIERMQGAFAPVGNGLWRGHVAGLPLHGVELREAYKTGPSERLLYLFTKASLNDPRALIRRKELDAEDLLMYRLLHQHVQQFQRDPKTMDLKDIDVADKKFRIALKELIADSTIEDRLEGLTPEQMLGRLTPEQIVAALPPEALELIARKLKS
jgi:hypothetical protein